MKTFYSAGYLRERGAQISTADPAFLNSGPFSHPVDLSRIDDYLADSVRKYRALLEDKPEYRSVPLLAVLFFEFFADHFSLYPREMNHLPEVSGIAKIVNDYARRKAANELTEDELLHRINTGNMTGLPPSSKDFIVVENTAARLALPAHFAELCIREEQ